MVINIKFKNGEDLKIDFIHDVKESGNYVDFVRNEVNSFSYKISDIDKIEISNLEVNH